MKRQSTDLAVLCNLIVAIYLNENLNFSSFLLKIEWTCSAHKPVHVSISNSSCHRKFVGGEGGGRGRGGKRTFFPNTNNNRRADFHLTKFVIITDYRLSSNPKFVIITDKQ